MSLKNQIPKFFQIDVSLLMYLIWMKALVFNKSNSFSIKNASLSIYRILFSERVNPLSHEYESFAFPAYQKVFQYLAKCALTLADQLPRAEWLGNIVSFHLARAL